MSVYKNQFNFNIKENNFIKNGLRQNSFVRPKLNQIKVFVFTQLLFMTLTHAGSFKLGQVINVVVASKRENAIITKIIYDKNTKQFVIKIKFNEYAGDCTELSVKQSEIIAPEKVNLGIIGSLNISAVVRWPPTSTSLAKSEGALSWLKSFPPTLDFIPKIYGARKVCPIGILPFCPSI